MANILIIVTGSVAALKLPLLIEKLQSQKKEDGSSIAVNIRVVVTKPSGHFFCLEQVRQLLSSPAHVYTDEDEWAAWSKIGDPVLHIDLRNWAHLGLIAPLDANTLGKISSGMCDNLATCVVRAWDMSKPLLFCPAMNVHMWSHPITKRGLDTLHQLHYIQVGPIAKKLACGDVGMGAMAEVDDIVRQVFRHLEPTVVEEDL